jgi:hypothetical protein
MERRSPRDEKGAAEVEHTPVGRTMNVVYLRNLFNKIFVEEDRSFTHWTVQATRGAKAG